MERSHNLAMLSLWEKTPKKQIHVKGVCISYLSLPPSEVLVWDGSRLVAVPAFSLLHNPTKTGMVFVADTEPEWRLRYTVFHEWHETQSQMGGELRAVEKTLRDMYRAIRILSAAHPKLLVQFSNAIQHGRSPVHLAAMAAELRLAKREMTENQFIEFLEEAYTNRI